jgi:Ca2+-binding EF-hand superfamily protein
MGAGNSRIISYDDAVSRLDQEEQARLRGAWKQLVTGSSVQQAGQAQPSVEELEGATVHRSLFIRSVLGGRFPDALEERLSFAFSGKNREFVTFRDFICGMTAIMKGDETLRAMFLFALFDVADSGYVERKDVLAIMLSTERRSMNREVVAQLVNKLFDGEDVRGGWGSEPRANFKAFQAWVGRYSDRANLFRWVHGKPAEQLVRVSAAMPVAVEQRGALEVSLAANTNFEAMEIGPLNARYQQLRRDSASGRVDQATFERAFCPALSPKLAQRLFAAFDEHRDGSVDLREFVAGVSACCRGTMEDVLAFCLSIHGDEGAGYTRATLFSVLGALATLGRVVDGVGSAEPAAALDRTQSEGVAADVNRAAVGDAASDAMQTDGANEADGGEADDGMELEASQSVPSQTSISWRGAREVAVGRLVDSAFEGVGDGAGGALELSKAQVMAWLAQSPEAQDFAGAGEGAPCRARSDGGADRARGRSPARHAVDNRGGAGDGRHGTRVRPGGARRPGRPGRAAGARTACA